MKVYTYNENNLDGLSLTCFCEAIADGSFIVFINKITSKYTRFSGNSYVINYIVEKLNNRDIIFTFNNLLAIWRSDYKDVIKELINDGYIE